MASTLITVLSIILLTTTLSAASKFKRVCYYSCAGPKLNVKSVNGTLCTHLIIGFAIVTNKTITPQNENDTLIYADAVQLKGTFPKLKVMLSIGGGGEEAGFHEAVNDVASLSAFCSGVVDLVDKYGFDGVDIDWEFPGWSKHDQDKDNFVSLLRMLRKLFDDPARGKRLLLSIAVAAQLTIIKTSYDIPNIVKYVDLINLMSYDYHDYTPYLPFIEFNAPLYARASELGYLATLNTNWSAFFWVENGTPKEMLMVGIPTYSHNYILADKSLITPGSPSLGDSVEYSYSQVCALLENADTIYRFDSEAGVPYAANGYLWSSFEDRLSIARKAAFIRDNNFGGAMTYNLNNDDHKMSCTLTKFPLQTIIFDTLDANERLDAEFSNDVLIELGEQG